jgi:predicted component of type VI protein secretion system
VLDLFHKGDSGFVYYSYSVMQLLNRYSLEQLMNTSSLQPDYSAEGHSVDVVESTAVAALPPANSSRQDLEDKWQKINQSISRILTDFPYYLSRLFSQYQQAITNIVLLLAILIAAKVALAVLGSLNEIPLVSTFLELVGLGYLVWFTNRYLLKAQNRQELLSQVQRAKRDILSSSNNSFQTDI